MSRRVSFSPEAASMNMHSKHGGPTKVGGGGNNKIWIFKLPKGSSRVVGGFLRQIGAKVAKAAMPLMSSNRRRRSCSTKVAVSSSAATTTFARSRSYAAETLDSQRAQAIEDCIQFFNSSSSSSFSLQRSDSVTSSC